MGYLRVVEPRPVVVPTKRPVTNNLILQLLAVVKVAVFGYVVILERLSEGVVVGGLRQ
jgi:hypothetical protein